jgi:pSer/pThr/pTyr-binding forkhead associated (FHA) protein
LRFRQREKSVAEENRTQLRITGPKTQRTFAIPTGTTIIGRLESSDLQLDHPQLLRRHARLDRTEEECQIIKFSGGNLLINGREIAAEIPTRLSLGDLIQIGPFRLIYEEVKAEEPAPVEAEILSEDDVLSQPDGAEEGEAKSAAEAPPAPPSSLLPPSVLSAPPPPPDRTPGARRTPSCRGRRAAR